MPRWKSVDEVADYLGLSSGSIRNQISQKRGVGKLFSKVGGLRRADLDKVDELFEKGEDVEPHE